MDTGKKPAESPERNFLSPFKESARPWLALARNAVPAAGVYWFAWSPNEVILQIWAAGVTALGVMLGFQMLAFAANGEGHFRETPLSARPFEAALFALAALLLLGSPYWFLLLLVVGVGNWTPAIILACMPKVVLPAAAVMAVNIAEEAGRGYERMTNDEIRHEFNWYFNMHLARLCVIFSLIFLLHSDAMVPLLMLGLSYVEIYPMSALRLFGGDSSLDPENKNRSPD